MQISYRQEILRKLVHLSSIWMVFVMAYVPGIRGFFFFAILAVLNLIVEYARYKKVPVITPLYEALFKNMLRESNGKFRPSGSPPYLASAAVTTLLFPLPFSIISFLCMMFGDTAAALIGRKFGKHKFSNGKSMEGCAAFLITDWLIVIGAYFITGTFGWIILVCGLIGVVLAMIAELFNEELHLDDNFSIPLIVGGMFRAGLLLSMYC